MNGHSDRVNRSSLFPADKRSRTFDEFSLRKTRMKNPFCAKAEINFEKLEEVVRESKSYETSLWKWIAKFNHCAKQCRTMISLIFDL